MMVLAGIAIGFVAGSAATIMTLFIAGHLRERASVPPPEWVDTGRWDDASSATRP